MTFYTEPEVRRYIMKNSKLFIGLLALALSVQAQNGRHAAQTRAARKHAFVTSNTFWTWYDNGSTTFSFSIRNQSGHDVKTLRYRVLFFDRKGVQIDFAEGTSGRIPNGLAHRESVTLDFDTGMSTRKLSASSRIEILGFDQDEKESLPH
jgi:uncharacterized protein YcfL